MKKLNLNKKVIAKLSDLDQLQIKGGLAKTTTFSECTHFLCCGNGCEATIGTCGTLECTNIGCESADCPPSAVNCTVQCA
jgi:hypothetical protein